MPEGPEVYLTGKLVNDSCKGVFFGGKIVKAPAHRSCEIAFDSPKYTITSETKGKELALTLQCEKNADNKLRILFNFGMSGHLKFSSADEEVKHSHLSFFTEGSPKMALRFIDVRRFGTWKCADSWGADRGPDPVFEYDKFRKNVLARSKKDNIFNKPICELMLQQKYFNGIGNYLRSEILHRAGIPPFTCARSVLEGLGEDDDGSGDFLQLCHDVPNEVIELGTGKNYDPTTSIEDHDDFNKWLQCYNQPGMNKLNDHNNRAVWYKGDPGPMAPAGQKPITKTAKNEPGKGKAKKSASSESKGEASGSKEDAGSDTNEKDSATAKNESDDVTVKSRKRGRPPATKKDTPADSDGDAVAPAPKRGRPKKETTSKGNDTVKTARKRGRPPKVKKTIPMEEDAGEAVAGDSPTEATD